MQIQIFVIKKYYSTKSGHTKYNPNDVGQFIPVSNVQYPSSFIMSTPVGITIFVQTTLRSMRPNNCRHLQLKYQYTITPNSIF